MHFTHHTRFCPCLLNVCVSRVSKLLALCGKKKEREMHSEQQVIKAITHFPHWFYTSGIIHLEYSLSTGLCRMFSALYPRTLIMTSFHFLLIPDSLVTHCAHLISIPCSLVSPDALCFFHSLTWAVLFSGKS